MHEYEAGILRIERFAFDTFVIEIDCPGIASEIAPGQFVQVRVGDGTDPFLRRTFSVAGADPEKGTCLLLVDVVGRGTSKLCSMRRGGSINIIGALGTGFDMTLGGDGPAVLVAGGTGAAPMLFLGKNLYAKGKRRVIIMMGARNERGFAAAESLLPDGVEFMKATDDGSCGFHGFVSGLLEFRAEEIVPSAIYTCGPHPMMKAVAAIANNRSIPCQVSLEERMACGIGACLGCAVKTTDGRMVRSCVDGPVFKADEVVL